MSQPKRYIVISLPPVIQEDEQGYFVSWDDYAALAAENEVLRKKVDWLQKADRLVIWNGTEWQVRHELNGETMVAK